MRTYIIDKSKKEEHVIDLNRTIVHSSELVQYQFCSIEDGVQKNHHDVFIRKLASQYFVSFDNVRWKKLARQDMPTIFLNVNKVYDIYRGYKPSGLNSTVEGGLVTQMPGKVVKIEVKVGDKVSRGDTLLILEAMKMENEIKATFDGVVKNILVQEGQPLEQGVSLMDVEPTQE